MVIIIFRKNNTGSNTLTLFNSQISMNLSPIFEINGAELFYGRMQIQQQIPRLISAYFLMIYPTLCLQLGQNSNTPPLPKCHVRPRRPPLDVRPANPRPVAATANAPNAAGPWKRLETIPTNAGTAGCGSGRGEELPKHARPHPTTSQCPPLLPPTRFMMPSFFNLFK